MKKTNIFLLVLTIILFSAISVSAFNTSVGYESGITCSANLISCENDGYLYRCNSEGNDRVLEKECKLGCEVWKGKDICTEDKLKEQVTEAENRATMILMVASGIIIVLIMAIVILYNKLKKK